MSIRHIRVKNFKSYRDLDVRLGPLNVLIGANASGKSNFVEVLRFLRDIAVQGLEDAISLQGGAQHLLSAQAQEDGVRRLTFSISADTVHKFYISKQNDETDEFEAFGVHTRNVSYRFQLSFYGEEQSEIIEDIVSLKCDFVQLNRDEEGELEPSEELGEGTIALRADQSGTPKCDLQLPSGVEFKESDILPPDEIASEEDTPPTLLLEKHFLHIPLFFHPSRVFWDREIAIHNFNSPLAKKPVEVRGRANLEEDGSNLALVLRRILKDEESRQQFLRLYRDLMHFVTEVDVEEHDRSLILRFGESYVHDLMFPATLVSDGTIDAAALVVALYFQDRAVVVIEEPEKNLHPYLIARLAAMLEDVSEHKQIVVTTHSPELVKHAARENILLVSRDNDGNSTITKPAENELLQAFLQNDLGIEDLYVKNLLET